jgi:predicted RNase H-like nuclease (RuvC/YqgF family)
MNNGDREIIKEYERLNGIVFEIELRLNNLKKTEGQISKERYSIQEKEYKDILENISPKLSSIETALRSKLDGYENDFKKLAEEIKPINNEIEQEKKLYKVGAISKRNYNITVKPLNDKLKNLTTKYNEKKSEIDELKKTLERKGPSWKADLSGFVGKADVLGKGDFKKDVWTGTKTVLTIAIIAIIGIPLIGIALGAGQVLAGPFVVIGVIVILIAIFGRFINFVKERW